MPAGAAARGPASFRSSARGGAGREGRPTQSTQHLHCVLPRIILSLEVHSLIQGMPRCCVQWPSAFALRASARFARAASSVDHCTRVLRLRSPLRELSTAVTSHNAGAALLGYLTDIEGSYDQWRRYVQLSRVLEPDPNDPDNKILLRDGCHFVFGGDAFDRGKGELRFVRELLALRRQYPDRVHLVLGEHHCVL